MNEINQINNEPVRKSRILLVDDEPGLRTAVKTFLEDEGFEIFTKSYDASSQRLCFIRKN